MKTADKPTNYILVKAHTDSEWDSCDFAIISISKEWKEQQAKRLINLEFSKEDIDFLNISYTNAFVDFYKIKQNKGQEPNLESLLGDTDWIFVELEQEEQEQFLAPQSTLNCYKIVFERFGFFFYKANGKHTGEEFWTAEIDLKEILTN